MFSDHKNIQIHIQLHFSNQTSSCTNANHFWTHSVYYHIHTSYLFYRLEIPLWWILLFVHCYISTVLPLEIPMALVAESFFLLSISTRKHIVFPVPLENNINTDTGKRIYTKQGEGEKENLNT